MTGRADETKRRRIFAANDARDGIDDRPDCEESDFKAGPTANRVAIEVATARFGAGANGVNIGRRVDSRKPCSVTRLKPRALALGSQPRSIEMAIDRSQPHRPLGVIARFVGQKSRISIKQRHCAVNLHNGGYAVNLPIQLDRHCLP